MNKSTVIDVAKTMCNLFHDCLRDKVFPAGSKINIEIERFGSEISVKRELLLSNGKVGCKQEVLIRTSDYNNWKNYTEEENRYLKAKGEFYDPDEQGRR